MRDFGLVATLKWGIWIARNPPLFEQKVARAEASQDDSDLKFAMSSWVW
jgi:hypothetical protein